MNITVTGSLGYVSTPVIQNLIEKGHSVTVISSKAERQNDIEAMGAKAAIGKMEDVAFLTGAFTGADAVYCMLAPYGDFTDPNNNASDVIIRAEDVVKNYIEAIKKSGVKRIVYLSSIGADKKKGVGLIIIHHYAEYALNKLPADVNVSFVRPGGFYKNLFAYIEAIKNTGVIAANYGGADIMNVVSNKDIAEAIVEELESKVTARNIRYVVSDEISCTEAAGILGDGIGKPDLKWVSISDSEQLARLKAQGMSDSFAFNFVEMNASIHDGSFYEHYNRNKPVLGKVKMQEFAKEFASIYNRQ